MNSQEQVVTFDDKTTRWYLWATLFWGIIGMLVGLLAAIQLAWWPANMEISWLTFGRIRPLHTSAVVFAFGGNAIFMAVNYSLQRLLKTRMWSDGLSRFVFWGWQSIIVAVAITYLAGISQAKEYAEMEWPIDLAITVVWVAFLINFFMTMAIRKVKHLYVAIWFYLASIITIAVLHVFNNLAIPVSLWKSYPLFAGVQDALVQWWYGHNAVGFLLTTPFLGMMYYFVPKVVNAPVYSYRLSIIHFWSLIFIYIWAGPHHLLYTSLPNWAQSLGVVFSIMLIAPSWGGMLNGLLTIRSAWSEVKSNPTIKFFVLALTWYGMATLEGPLLSLKTLNKVTHYTDWIIAHVHGGALGWVGGMIFAIFYWIVPKLYRTKLYSVRLANWHFWTATIGIGLYVVSMWVAGITQGSMWLALNDEGLLMYPNFLETVLAIVPFYWIRAIGGLLYLGGVFLCAYNLIKTAQLAESPHDESITVKPERHIEPRTSHEWLENKGLVFGSLTFVVILIGGIVEFVPAFIIESNVPTISAVKPYTPAELVGRDIYLREGCYNCHSQMIRTIPEESLRYGYRSLSGEFVYDRPFQWGSKRTGPDLHRLGKKYPDLWHYKHMIDPRSTSPGSIMPSYKWLENAEADLSDLPSKLKVLRQLNVPYGEEVLRDPEKFYDLQVAEIVSNLKMSGVEISGRSELVAIIAYMQKLGIEVKTMSASELEAIKSNN